MSKDGRFVKIRNNGSARVGYEIDLNQPAASIIKAYARIGTIAAAFIFAMGISYGAYCYTTPYSYVGVDINPSIELTTNVFDRIIGAEALNEDGKKLLAASDLKNTRLESGVADLLDSAVQQGYIKPDSVDTIVFSVTSRNEDKSAHIESDLKVAADSQLGKDKVKTDVVVGKASASQHEQAKKTGVTAGKLSIMEEAVKSDPGLKLEDLKDIPVKDILKKYKIDKQFDKELEKEAEKAGGNNAGNGKGKAVGRGKAQGGGSVDADTGDGSKDSGTSGNGSAGSSMGDTGSSIGNAGSTDSTDATSTAFYDGTQGQAGGKPGKGGGKVDAGTSGEDRGHNAGWKEGSSGDKNNGQGNSGGNKGVGQGQKKESGDERNQNNWTSKDNQDNQDNKDNNDNKGNKDNKDNKNKNGQLEKERPGSSKQTSSSGKGKTEIENSGGGDQNTKAGWVNSGSGNFGGEKQLNSRKQQKWDNRKESENQKEQPKYGQQQQGKQQKSDRHGESLAGRGFDNLLRFFGLERDNGQD